MIVRDAIILVGGKGTRLQSVISDRPKPLAPVCGRPFLYWLLLSLKEQGLCRVVLAAGHQSEKIHDFVRSVHIPGLEILVSVEEQPLGTAGGMKKALSFLSDEPVLVMNGDSYCVWYLQQMVETFERHQARCVMWLSQMRHADRFGLVEISQDQEVVAFKEKQYAEEALVNAGVYLFYPRFLEGIQDNQFASFENEVLSPAVKTGLYAVVGIDGLVDIGTPESYEQSQIELKAKLEHFISLE